MAKEKKKGYEESVVAFEAEVVDVFSGAEEGAARDVEVAFGEGGDGRFERPPVLSSSDISVPVRPNFFFPFPFKNIK